MTLSCVKLRKPKTQNSLADPGIHNTATQKQNPVSLLLWSLVHLLFPETGLSLLRQSSKRWSSDLEPPTRAESLPPTARVY